MATHDYPTMIEIGDTTIVSADCITEYFACDLGACRGACCIEGDAGAPVTTEEVGEIERALPAVSGKMSRQARDVVSRQGVSYRAQDGDLVTSIVDGRNCVFTCTGADGCCLCALEQAHAEGKISFVKPISCALYPIRVSPLAGGKRLALNYDRWTICAAAREAGRKSHVRVYEFLREPLIRAFGKDWYDELALTAEELLRQHILE